MMSMSMSSLQPTTSRIRPTTTTTTTATTTRSRSSPSLPLRLYHSSFTTSTISSTTSSSSSQDNNNNNNNENKTDDDDDDFEWPSVYEEASEMVMVSHLLYPLSFLIRQAKQGHLKDSATVLELLQTIRDNDISTNLSISQLLNIVDNNYDYLSQHRTDLDDCLKMLQHWSSQYNSQIYPPGSVRLLEFDDHYDQQRLAYGLFIDKIRRRITLVFRGTYADGTADWKRNIQIDQIEIPAPYNLQPILRNKLHHKQKQQNQYSDDDNDNNDNEPIITMKVHHGLYDYLFDNTYCLYGSKYYGKERNEEILDLLQQCLVEYPRYKIYVTGHSMGGNLAKLFAFYLSTSRNAYNLPKPVTCICVGSPVMGDEGYSLAMTCAEELGWLRHLSIKNEGDVICYTPPLIQYQPSGMHLRLHRTEGHLFGILPDLEFWRSIMTIHFKVCYVL